MWVELPPGMLRTAEGTVALRTQIEELKPPGPLDTGRYWQICTILLWWGNALVNHIGWFSWCKYSKLDCYHTIKETSLKPELEKEGIAYWF